MQADKLRQAKLSRVTVVRCRGDSPFSRCATSIRSACHAVVAAAFCCHHRPLVLNERHGRRSGVAWLYGSIRLHGQGELRSRCSAYYEWSGLCATSSCSHPSNHPSNLNRHLVGTFEQCR